MAPNINGVQIKKLEIHEDERGNFREVIKQTEEIIDSIKQISLSRTKPGTIKAFHWHKYQDDIFHVLQGNAQIVLYDGREGSSTKGKTQVILSGENYGSEIIYIPKGVFHGYKVLGNKDLEMLYIMDQEYNALNPDEERVDFNDLKINFDWEKNISTSSKPNQKVLIIGASGRLGSQLMKDFSKNYEVIGTFNKNKKQGLIHLDITDFNQVKSVLDEENPEIIIIASAKTNVDLCEIERDEAEKVNVQGIKNIAENCKNQKVVFYSSDYIFDGTKKEYLEEDIPNPLNFYGELKLRAEGIIGSLPNHLICRTSSLYGAERDNTKFINKIIDSLRGGKEIKVIIDYVATPSLILDVSLATLSLVKKNKKGIYHIAGDSAHSLYEIAFKVAEIFEFDKNLIKPIKKESYDSSVKKTSSILNIEKLKKEGIFPKKLKEGLKQVKAYQDKYKLLKSCRICGNKDLITYLDLGETPLANGFITSQQIDNEYKFSLRTILCPECYLSQIDTIVNQEFIFKDYFYRTSISQYFKNHCKELAEELIDSNILTRNDLIIDIASNDGTLLIPFREKGIPVLGIEPATNLSKIANDSGVPTIESFWDTTLAEKLTKTRKNAKIITSFNVLAHVNDIHEFMRGIKLLLVPGGYFIAEFPHLLHLIDKTEFDTIYHEHLSYFLIKPLMKLAELHNLRIAKVKEFDVHGGSIRLYIEHKEYTDRSDGSVQAIIDKEEQAGLYDIKTYLEFGEKTNKIKEELVLKLIELKSLGKTICGFGASAKGNTLLNYSNINTNLIDYIFDDTPEKQNKFTPGTHIPVIDGDLLMEKKPDYLLLLAWNHAEEIIAKTKEYKEKGGNYIIPIPRIKII